MTDEPDLDSAYALASKEETQRLYARWAQTYDSDFVEATGYRFPRLVAERFVAHGGTGPCLDVGCGTGAVAEHLPEGLVLDGLDFSQEMLQVARDKRLYRTLIQADLTEPLSLASGSYAGLVSSGTFTHGHVGPEALPELARILRPGALAVMSIKPEIWETRRFEAAFEALSDLVTPPLISEHELYAVGSAPDGHDSDTCFLARFTRL